MCADVVSYDTQHLQQKDDEDLEEDDIRLQTEVLFKITYNSYTNLYSFEFLSGR